jgi:hypothetical protein
VYIYSLIIVLIIRLFDQDAFAVYTHGLFVCFALLVRYHHTIRPSLIYIYISKLIQDLDHLYCKVEDMESVQHTL